MIVGNGLIAKSFSNINHNNILVFASGVSNSSETDLSEFRREENLIREWIEKSEELLFIYFSTCSIYDNSKRDSPYVYHKLRMESVVKENCKKYLIFRVSNVVGFGGNSNLLMNYLCDRLISGELISVFKYANRNLLDIDDLVKIVQYVIESDKLNRSINIAYKSSFTSLEIIETFEKVLNKKFNKIVVEQGDSYDIEIDDYGDVFDKNQKGLDYLSNLIEKYYRMRIV